MPEKRNDVALGIFADPQAMLRALSALREEGFADLTVFSPVPERAVWEALEPGPSGVRFWTLVGALLGCASGFALTIGTALDWPLRTSAKPIVSLPPFIIIAFELTILLGALGAVAGFLFNARLPRRTAKIVYDLRFSVDRFGLAVRDGSRITKAHEILRAAGAEEVRVEEG